MTRSNGNRGGRIRGRPRGGEGPLGATGGEAEQERPRPGECKVFHQYRRSGTRGREAANDTLSRAGNQPGSGNELADLAIGCGNLQASRFLKGVCSMTPRILMGSIVLTTYLAGGAAGARAASADTAGPRAANEDAAFRGLYKELVEINTTRSVGSCTRAAEAMRARLGAAGNPGIGHANPRPRRSPERWRTDRRAARPGPARQTDPAPRAHRCGGSEAGGLGARSVQAGRGERLVLCARRERR